MDPTLSLFIGDGLRVEDRSEIINWDVGQEVAAGSDPELALIEGRALRLRRSFLQLRSANAPSNDNVSPAIVPSLSNSYSILT
jgi:hypothetical protein